MKIFKSLLLISSLSSLSYATPQGQPLGDDIGQGTVFHLTKHISDSKAELKEKIDQLDQRVSAGFANVDQKFTQMDSKFEKMQCELTYVSGNLTSFMSEMRAWKEEDRKWKNAIISRVEKLEVGLYNTFMENILLNPLTYIGVGTALGGGRLDIAKYERSAYACYIASSLMLGQTLWNWVKPSVLNTIEDVVRFGGYLGFGALSFALHENKDKINPTVEATSSAISTIFGGGLVAYSYFNNIKLLDKAREDAKKDKAQTQDL